MPYRMTFRADVVSKDAATVRQAINADYSQKFGLNAAITAGMAFCRRFQAIGLDSKIQVFGKPVLVGADGTGPAIGAGLLAEQEFAVIDTEDLGLRRAIAARNGGSGAQLPAPGAGDDGLEDLGDDA